jgi:hypothetical protein
MNFREPTFQELFASSHKKKLAMLQSSIFVNKSLATGGITEAIKAMPTNLPNSKPYNQVIFERSTASELTKNYIKVNWRVIFISAVFGGGIVYLTYVINEHNKKIKKNNFN